MPTITGRMPAKVDTAHARNSAKGFPRNVSLAQSISHPITSCLNCAHNLASVICLKRALFPRMAIEAASFGTVSVRVVGQMPCCDSLRNENSVLIEVPSIIASEARPRVS